MNARTSPSWDPVQYGRYADERSRPFLDLLDRVRPQREVRRVIDLGCGPGHLTALLSQRWPEAQVLGVDSSPEMIRTASELTAENLAFELGEIRDFEAEGVDVLISNAALQWVPGHRELLALWAAQLERGAALAMQVPANFSAPSHALMRQVASEEPFASRLGGVLRHDDAVAAPEEYLALMGGAGMLPDVWTTTYQHILQGERPVLEWVRGTGLRPVLDALGPEAAAEFEERYHAELERAYPRLPFGTPFGFTRLFAVGTKI